MCCRLPNAACIRVSWSLHTMGHVEQCLTRPVQCNALSCCWIPRDRWRLGQLTSARHLTGDSSMHSKPAVKHTASIHCFTRTGPIIITHIFLLNEFIGPLIPKVVFSDRGAQGHVEELKAAGGGPCMSISAASFSSVQKVSCGQ
jgi:hypothetical protein